MENLEISNTQICLLCMFIGVIIMMFIITQSKPIQIVKVRKPIIQKNETNIVKKSLIEGAGRGLFAGKNYKEGEIIEECDYLIDKPENLMGTILIDYFWDDIINGEKKALIPVTGNCNLANHSDKPNTKVLVNSDKNKLYLIAIKFIRKGDEIYNSYGDNYWNDRKGHEKK
jgi:uncharacterized protein